MELLNKANFAVTVAAFVFVSAIVIGVF